MYRSSCRLSSMCSEGRIFYFLSNMSYLEAYETKNKLFIIIPLFILFLKWIDRYVIFVRLFFEDYGGHKLFFFHFLPFAY